MANGFGMIKGYELESLKERFPKGSRVELDYMNDPYTHIPAGTKGTVEFIDSIGTIFVKWDCGSGLGVVYGEDRCHRIEE